MICLHGQTVNIDHLAGGIPHFEAEFCLISGNEVIIVKKEEAPNSTYVIDDIRSPYIHNSNWVFGEGFVTIHGQTKLTTSAEEFVPAGSSVLKDVPKPYLKEGMIHVFQKKDFVRDHYDPLTGRITKYYKVVEFEAPSKGWVLARYAGYNAGIDAKTMAYSKVIDPTTSTSILGLIRVLLMRSEKEEVNLSVYDRVRKFINIRSSLDSALHTLKLEFKDDRGRLEWGDVEYDFETIVSNLSKTR